MFWKPLEDWAFREMQFSVFFFFFLGGGVQSLGLFVLLCSEFRCFFCSVRRLPAVSSGRSVGVLLRCLGFKVRV